MASFYVSVFLYSLLILRLAKTLFEMSVIKFVKIFPGYLDIDHLSVALSLIKTMQCKSMIVKSMFFSLLHATCSRVRPISLNFQYTTTTICVQQSERH